MASREKSLVGENLHVLVRAAALVASENIAAQKAKFEDEEKLRYSVDATVRFATDDFVVGYAVGLATKHVELNERKIQEIRMDDLCAALQERLQSHFPSIDVIHSYKGGSNRVVCGLLFGLRDPTFDGKYGSLHKVWSLMVPYQLAPGVYLQEYAHQNLQISSAEFEAVGRAGEEMYSRYTSVGAPTNEMPTSEYSRKSNALSRLKEKFFSIFSS